MRSNEVAGNEPCVKMRPARFRRCRESAADPLLAAVTTLSIATPVGSRPRTAARKEKLPSEQPMAIAAGRVKSTRTRGGAKEVSRSSVGAAPRLGTASVPEMTSDAECPEERGIPGQRSASSIGGSDAEPAESLPTWPSGPPNSAHRDVVSIVLDALRHPPPTGPLFDVHQRGTRPIVCRVVASSDVPGHLSSSQLAYRPLLMAGAPDPHMNTPLFSSPTLIGTTQAVSTAQERVDMPVREWRTERESSNSEICEEVGQEWQKCCGKKVDQHAQLQPGTYHTLAGSSLLQKVGSSIASPVSLGTMTTTEGNPNCNIYSSRPCPQMYATCSQLKAEESKLCHSQFSAVHERPAPSVNILPHREKDACFSRSLRPRRRGKPSTSAQDCTIPAMSTPEISQPRMYSLAGLVPAHQGSCPKNPVRFHSEEVPEQPACQGTLFRAPFPGPRSCGISNGSQPAKSPLPCSENWIQQGPMPNDLYAPTTSSAQGSQFVMPCVTQFSLGQVSLPSSGQYLLSTPDAATGIPVCWPGQHQEPKPSYDTVPVPPLSWPPISTSPPSLAVTMPQPLTLPQGCTVPERMRKTVHKPEQLEFPVFKGNLPCIQCAVPASMAVSSASVMSPESASPLLVTVPTAAPLTSQPPFSQQQPTTNKKYHRKGGAMAEFLEGGFPALDINGKTGSLDCGGVVPMPASAMLVAPVSSPAQSHKMGGVPRKRGTTGRIDQKSKKQRRGGKNSSDQAAGESAAKKENEVTTSGRLGRVPKGIAQTPDAATVPQENRVQSAKNLTKASCKTFGKPFLQDARCYDIAPKLHKCKECWTRQSGSNENMPNICRFYAFRKLCYSKTGVVHRGGFLEPNDASEEDMKLWLPGLDHTPSDTEVTTAKVILSHVGNQFFALINQETEARSLHMGDNTILWKRAVQGAREICDVCKTTLFNIHWTCSKCGFVACIDCYKARKNGTVKADGMPMTDRGEFKWPLCTNRHRHEQGNLMMTQIIASTVLSDMSQQVRRFFHEWSSLCNRGVWNSDGSCRPCSSDGLCRPLMSAVNSRFSDKKGTAASRDMGHSCELRKRPANRVMNTSGEVGGNSSSFAEGRPLPILTSGVFLSSSKMGDTSGIQQQSDECSNKSQDLSRTLLDLLGQPNGNSVKKTLLDEVMAVTVERIGKDSQRYGSLRKGCKVLPVHTCTLAQSSLSFPRVPHSWLCSGKLLVLCEPRNKENLPLFQAQWKRGHPVLISGVFNNLDASLWHPSGFCRDFGHMQTDLIDCRTGRILRDQPMRIFWDGFENLRKRIKDEDGKYMLLKLKDWPPGDDFSDVLPSRFADLMNALPLPEYTHRDGVFNLVGRLPECFVRPDLGPKMYTAYGSALHSGKGTTNLHLDVSDAVNVMVYVGILKDGSDKEHIREALKAIDEACDALTRKRVREKGARPGALWHIYDASDADKIRELLSKVAVERGGKVEPLHDPIHDQVWYLDRELRERLHREYSVEGYAIAQCLGDAVFIPAGAPHQVRNLHNCIKVAEDFVSPENIAHCFGLTHEFRQLSDTHTNHEDKLQIKNVIYHAVKDALGVLLASPSVEK